MSLIDNLFDRAPRAPRVAVETRAVDVPSKVFIEKVDVESYEYSLDPPAILDRFYDLLHGAYAPINCLELFHCVPEVFAPIHEIASRVADATWQLKKDWNDEVDYKDGAFNRLFTQANPLQTTTTLIYFAVVYEILTGKQIWYLNRPSSLMFGKPYENILSWSNLRAHKVFINQHKNIDPYSATDIKDFIKNIEENRADGTKRIFEPDNLITFLNLSLDDAAYDLNKTVSYLAGASKPIANLIPVYEARKVIYIKRGALGFVVNRAKDASGTIKLTDAEKKELAALEDSTYGITAGKSPLKYTGANVDFLRTSMSIQELQPFEETLADAVAIYRVLRVPRHLVPSKDNSTFANADSDMKSFYQDVIIPWAKRYAQAFTTKMGFNENRRYVFPDYSHIDVLSENKKDKASVDNLNATTAILLYEKGVVKKNERNAMLGYASVPEGDVYAGEGDNKDPLAVQLGVGGVQAMQAVLADQGMSEDAKAAALEILFGVSPEDAKRLVIPKEIKEDENITPKGKGTPPQAGADKLP